MFPRREVCDPARALAPGLASPQTFYLVGDRIKLQLPHPRLMSITDLELMIDALERGQAPAGALRLLIGQGAASERLVQARRRIDSAGCASWLQMPPEGELEQASAVYTHKRHPHNIIISDPQQSTQSSYTALLLADERCADMSDHLSGQHVQGMVLIEASRQMVLAVGEKFLISPEHRGQRGFVTHRLDAQFHDFVLPLEVKMTCQIDNLRRGACSNFRADVTIGFQQAGTVSAEVKVTLSVLDKRFLEDHESRLIRRQLAQREPPQEAKPS